MRSRTESPAAPDPQRPIRLWLAVGLAGLLALHWYAAPDVPWPQLLAGLFSD